MQNSARTARMINDEERFALFITSANFSLLKLSAKWKFAGLKARGILSPEGGIIVAKGRRRVAAEPLVMHKK